MKEMKKFYTGAFLFAVIIFCSCLMGHKILNSGLSSAGQGDSVSDTNFGNFLAAQHALYVNDFNNAARMADAVNSDNKIVLNMQNLADFFNGKMPDKPEKFKDSKELVDGLVYDAFLIQKDDWKSVYDRHSKDSTILAAPLRIFSGVKAGKTKETIKFIDSLKTNDSWKAFTRGQIAVLNNDVEGAAKEFAKVHPDFMNVNDYLYLMSFYKENGMTEDMKILRDDFMARPGGMYILKYPDIPDWSNYAGDKNILVFSLIQNISHTQVMVYTDLSLLFLRFAQIISNESNMGAINYYLGQYYFYNSGDYKTCFEKIKNTSPLYLFGVLSIAERAGDFKTIQKIARENPLFIPAIQLTVRQHIKNGKRGAALSVLNRALRQKNLPEEGMAYFLRQRAYVYLKFGDAARAQKDLYTIKSSGGSMNPEMMSLQAHAWLLQNKNLDEAYNNVMSMIKINNSDIYAWDLMGQIVAKKEGVENALEIMESVESTGARASMVFEHLGDLYAERGDKDKALRAYNQALDLSDDCMIVVPFVEKKIRKLK